MSEASSRPLQIMVAGRLTPEQKEQVQAAAPDARFRFASKTAELRDVLHAADVLGTPPRELTSELLEIGKNLQLIHLSSAGVDEALSPALIANQATLTCSKGNGAIPLSEHAMWLMLMLNRNAIRWIRAQDESRWDLFVHGELNGLTLGLIGLGNSGADLALKAKAFHMNVLGIRRSNVPVPGVDELLPISSLHELLSRSDIVVVSLPRTKDTEGMFGEAEFRSMKDSAFFICFSRGGLVDDNALLRALREGWIAGAGMDAHSEEPLPPDSPFWTAPNTIVTPHNGASTPQTRQRGVDYLVANIRNFVAGRPLVNVVDKEAGY